MGTIPVKISEHEKIPLKIKENSDKLNLGFNTKGIIIKPITITENGVYRAGGGAFNPVTVEVFPPLQSKEIIPIEEIQEIVADDGFYGLDKVTIKAIPSDYVGSNIHRRDSDDLFADGPIIHVPEGYYELDEQKSVYVVNQATPVIEINNSTGLITSNLTQESGYVYGTTTSSQEQLSTQNSTTIQPTEQEQIATPINTFTLGDIKVGAIDSSYVGSNIPRHDSSDLIVNGKQIITPYGYYESNASAEVHTATHIKPTISLNQSTGLITSTHEQETGYVEQDTKQETLQLNVQQAKTVAPTLSDQIVVEAGKFTTGNVVVTSMPTATQATPQLSLNQSNGIVTATSNQSAGYVVQGTTSNTLQLDVQQAKEVTPTETSQVAVAKNKYTTGNVTIKAIPKDYVGSNIPRKSSSDLTISGPTVNVPYGYYESNSSATVLNAGTVHKEITTKDEVYTIPEGYHSGSGTVSISQEERNKIIGNNILKGVTILGVEGLLESLVPDGDDLEYGDNTQPIVNIAALDFVIPEGDESSSLVGTGKAGFSLVGE